jgi:hypothetical protein
LADSSIRCAIGLLACRRLTCAATGQRIKFRRSGALVGQADRRTLWVRPIVNGPLAMCHATSRGGDSAFVGSANHGCNRLSGGSLSPRDTPLSVARDADLGTAQDFPETLKSRTDSEAYVGQVGNLQPIVNRPVSVERTACPSKDAVARDAHQATAQYSWERASSPPQKRVHTSVNAARTSACATISVGHALACPRPHPVNIRCAQR